MSAIPELDDRVKRAVTALNDSGLAPGLVVQQCIADLSCRTGISRECRSKLRAAFDRLLIALNNVKGRVVNMVSLVKTAMKDTIDEVRLRFEFCSMIEAAART